MKWKTPLGCITSNGNCSIDSETESEIEGNITINGKKFGTAFTTLSPTSMAFSLHRKYSFFKTCLGVANSSTYSEASYGNKKGSTKFQILGDGVPFKINGRNWLTKEDNQNATCLLIGVGHVKMLELRSQSHDRKCGASAWVDAAVFLKGMSFRFSIRYCPVYKGL